MKAFFLAPILFYILFFIFYIPAKADISCQPIYGGGQTCVSTGNILVDKKVLNPETQKMTDNLTVNDGKFVPGANINFQINLTNTGHAEIKHIDVKDVFSQYVVFTQAPGKFDANTKILTFEVADLKPKETRTFTVVGKIVEANRLPADLGIVCNATFATAITSDSGTSQDTAQFCIQKPSQASQKQVLAAQTSKGRFPVFPAPSITTSPATGGELLPIISLIPAGIAGWLLRKYS